MITKNFKHLLAMVLLNNGSQATPAYLPVTTMNGTTQYIGGRMYFPGTVTYSVSTSSSSTGIHLGTGDTAPTENDYALESKISSGITASTPTRQYNKDNNGNPYLTLMFTVTNTTSSDIIVKEIGFVQSAYLATNMGSSQSSNGTHILLDRTILSQPVTIPANDSAAIKYTLKVDVT